MLTRTLSPHMRFVALACCLLASLPVRGQDAFTPPAERYGVSWGDTPDVVIDKSGRAPDSDRPAGALTYVGASGGQTIYTFAPGGLAVIVEASPLMRDPDAAAAEYERYKVALVNLYGAPVLEDSPRPDAPQVLDTVWAPPGELRTVELTIDSVESGGQLGHFVLVRTVGPEANAPPGR